MIPEIIFSTLVALAMGIFIYALYDNQNHLYANIVLTVVSGVTFAYLGGAVSLGAVVFTSASMGQLLGYFSWISFGSAIFMVADALFEAINDDTPLEPGDAEQSP